MDMESYVSILFFFYLSAIVLWLSMKMKNSCFIMTLNPVFTATDLFFTSLDNVC